MKVALDAMGGDFAPSPVVQGGVEAVAQYDGLELVLVGPEDVVRPLVAEFRGEGLPISVVHAPQVVDMHESPAEALRRKPQSSIMKCWELLARREVDAIVSAGNTGAVVAGGLFTRRFLPGIKRPGIAVSIPAPTGACVLIDVGANTTPRPEHLFQYGLMGLVYAQKIHQVEHPRIGLLNVGTEDVKGNELTKETHRLFNSSHLAENFVGNIEGRDIFVGKADVIVCDGFVGNVVLKVCEGLVEMMLRTTAEELLRRFPGDMSGHVRECFQSLSQRYHYSTYGGAPLLGIDGICMICHGSSDAHAIRNAVRAAAEFVRLGVNAAIKQELALD